jgi:hypothetical protein
VTLTLDPQTERELESLAAARGVAPEAAFIEAVKEWAARRKTNGQSSAQSEADEQSANEARRVAAFAALGAFKGKMPSLDDFLADRHAVAQAEAEKDAQRLAR